MKKGGKFWSNDILKQTTLIIIEDNTEPFTNKEDNKEIISPITEIKSG